MKRFFRRYGLITACLLVLFASGIAAGFRWAQYQEAAGFGTAAGNVQVVGTASEQWSDQAAAALQKDLGLTAEQTENVRTGLAGPARAIFEEKQRGNLRVHLRLLEVHDTLARDAGLTDQQKTRLRSRREQLRRHILDKFHDLLSERPEPILSEA